MTVTMFPTHKILDLHRFHHRHCKIGYKTIFINQVHRNSQRKSKTFAAAVIFINYQQLVEVNVKIFKQNKFKQYIFEKMVLKKYD